MLKRRAVIVAAAIAFLRSLSSGSAAIMVA